jgi:16S rRNA (adenine1518-N6/adenine1519-N6)-dimethyltransferase
MPRQTYTYLRGLFESKGLSPRRDLGQNFLIDLNLHEFIARSAELTPDDVVLEVGPGAGALTTLLAREAGAVVSVELDPAMAELTREATAEFPNVRVLHTDVLRNKNNLNPDVVDQIRSGLAAMPGRRLKLVANLPYNIATPLIVNLLVHPDLAPSLMVVTIQKELAERMIAAPQASSYGALSVMMTALARVEIIRLLSPKVFWPQPKVESAIVRIEPDPALRAAIPDLAWFHNVVRRVFLHRRKNLRRVIYSQWRDRFADKAEVDAFLAGMGLSETGIIRAEAMNVEELLDLADAMKRHFGEAATTIPDDDDEAVDDADADTEERDGSG